ncbi:2OG-Fe(II) oxygenase [Microdochium nivale]|nr:2OG-Fe(II) oxygenase [Microdochium nivale]
MFASLKQSIVSGKTDPSVSLPSARVPKKPTATTTARRPPPPGPVQVAYGSKQVAIPDGFLERPAADSKPITFQQIDWSKTPVPEFKGCYAVVLDNVLSPSECRTLITLAEESVLDEDKIHTTTTATVSDNSALPSDGDNEATTASPADAAAASNTTTTPLASSWRPAMVNIGGGFEILEPTYRNSDRIVWDHQDLIQRLWDHRLSTVPQIRGDSSSSSSSPLPSFAQGDLPGYPLPTHWDASLRRYVPDDDRMAARWEFVRMNKRMRFLKYGPGQFFRAHCDGAYTERDVQDVPRFEGKGVDLTTHFTLHLYLNDSQQAILAELDSQQEGRGVSSQDSEDSQEDDKKKRAALAAWEATHNDVGDKVSLVGGATSFLSDNEERSVAVDPRAGRVLIFQHRKLYHAGDDVLDGVKYTMRAELMYRLAVPGERAEQDKE